MNIEIHDAGVVVVGTANCRKFEALRKGTASQIGAVLMPGEAGPDATNIALTTLVNLALRTMGDVEAASNGDPACIGAVERMEQAQAAREATDELERRERSLAAQGDEATS